MAYTPTSWTPGVFGTEITSTRLNNIETGISNSVEKDAETINVKNHGVVGDGVTDDTTALHAVRDLSAIGAKIYIPKGTYLCSPLTLNKAGQVWELAEGAVIKAAASLASLNFITISADGVKFSGGNVDGNKANQSTDVNGIVVAADNVTIRDVVAENCRGNGIALASGATGCSIIGNTCRDNGVSTNASAGIQVVDGARNRIIGNLCERNGSYAMGGTYDGDGIRLQGASGTGHNVVQGNVCRSNARRGIKLQQGPATITGNECTDNGVAGIGVTNSANPQNTPSVISGNTLLANYRGFQLDTCRNLSISGNLVADSLEYGLLANTNANGIVLSGNMFARSQRYGAAVQGCRDWTITGNQFIDNGQNGTNTYGLSLEDDSGLTQSCQRINVTGNTSHNSASLTTQTRGINVSGTAPDRITIVGNATHNGVTSSVVVTSNATNSFSWANSGNLTNNQDVAWNSFYMAAGAFIGGTTAAGGLMLLNSSAHRLGFWGKTPVTQPATVTAAPTQTGSYVQADVQAIATSLNDLITKLKSMGLIA